MAGCACVRACVRIPVAAAAGSPGMRPSGGLRGVAGSAPWPVPAAAPHSDSAEPPSCSGTTARRSTAARGSLDLWEEGGYSHQLEHNMGAGDHDIPTGSVVGTLGRTMISHDIQ